MSVIKIRMRLLFVKHEGVMDLENNLIFSLQTNIIQKVNRLYGQAIRQTSILLRFTVSFSTSRSFLENFYVKRKFDTHPTIQRYFQVVSEAVVCHLFSVFGMVMMRNVSVSFQSLGVVFCCHEYHCATMTAVPKRMLN